MPDQPRPAAPQATDPAPDPAAPYGRAPSGEPLGVGSVLLPTTDPLIGKTIAEHTTRAAWARSLHYSDETVSWTEHVITFTDGTRWSIAEDHTEVDADTITYTEPDDDQPPAGEPHPRDLAPIADLDNLHHYRTAFDLIPTIKPQTVQHDAGPYYVGPLEPAATIAKARRAIAEHPDMAGGDWRVTFHHAQRPWTEPLETGQSGIGNATERRERAWRYALGAFLTDGPHPLT